MSLSSLPVELLTSIAQELEDRKSLKQFTLVSTFCRAASRRLLWTRVHLQCLDGIHDENELVMFIRTDRELAEGIVDLRISYSTSSYPKPLIIKTEDLLNLTTTFPNLTALLVDSVGQIVNSPQFSHNQIFEFSFLTHLDIDSSDDLSFVHLKYILAISPYVNSLKLTERGHGEEYLTIYNCPVLKHLEIVTSFPCEIFRHDQPLIPFTSMSKLESLKIETESDIHRENLNAILTCCKSTLKSLFYFTWGHVRYESVQFVIPKMIQLEVLDLAMLGHLPLNFLQIISPTIQIMKVALGRSHLEHLRDNPRPELNLIEITIESGDWYGWQFSSDDRPEQKWKLIPPSVEVIRVDYQIRYCSTLDLFALIKANRKGSMLKRVSIDLIEDYPRFPSNFDREPKALFDLFKEINIHLEFREEGR